MHGTEWLDYMLWNPYGPDPGGEDDEVERDEAGRCLSCECFEDDDDDPDCECACHEEKRMDRPCEFCECDDDDVDSSCTCQCHKEQLDQELVEALLAYDEICEELRNLKLQKEELREQVQQIMLTCGQKARKIETTEARFKLTVATSTEVVYDESVLRERIGEKYQTILAPDPKKMRKNMVLISPALTPFLDKIGTPSPTLVKKQIESEQIPMEAFRGAFKKIHKARLTIRKMVQDPKRVAPPPLGEDSV